MARIRNILREGLEGLLATSEVLIFFCTCRYIWNFSLLSHTLSLVSLISLFGRCTIARKVSGLRLGPRPYMRISTRVQKLWFSGWRLIRPSLRNITIHAFKVRQYGKLSFAFLRCSFCYNIEATNGEGTIVSPRKWAFHCDGSKETHSYENYAERPEGRWGPNPISQPKFCTALQPNHWF